MPTFQVYLAHLILIFQCQCVFRTRSIGFAESQYHHLETPRVEEELSVSLLPLLQQQLLLLLRQKCQFFVFDVRSGHLLHFRKFKKTFCENDFPDTQINTLYSLIQSQLLFNAYLAAIGIEILENLTCDLQAIHYSYYYRQHSVIKNQLQCK